MHTKFQPENAKGRDNFEDRGTAGRIIVKQSLKKRDSRTWCRTFGFCYTTMWVGEGGGVSRDPYLPKRTSCLYYSPNIV